MEEQEERYGMEGRQAWEWATNIEWIDEVVFAFQFWCTA